jgi:hypothetical protein
LSFLAKSTLPGKGVFVLNIPWLRGDRGNSDEIAEGVVSDESPLLRLETVGDVVKLAHGSVGPNLDGPGGSFKPVENA